MDAARRRELEASLRRELGRHAAEDGLDSAGRVVWLLEQLENYVERWIGLGSAAAEGLAPASNDLFGMIEIGTAVTSEALQALGLEATAASWRKFLIILAEMRTGNSMLDPRALAQSLALVRSALPR